MSWIVNASGGRAAPCAAAVNAPTSTGPPAGIVAGATQTRPRRRHPDRLLRDEALGCAGRQLSPGPAGLISLRLSVRSRWLDRSLRHDPQTHSGSPATAAPAADGLVLAGSPLPARARRLSVA